MTQNQLLRWAQKFPQKQPFVLVVDAPTLFSGGGVLYAPDGKPTSLRLLSDQNFNQRIVLGKVINFVVLVSSWIWLNERNQRYVRAIAEQTDVYDLSELAANELADLLA